MKYVMKTEEKCRKGKQRRDLIAGKERERDVRAINERSLPQEEREKRGSMSHR